MSKAWIGLLVATVLVAHVSGAQSAPSSYNDRVDDASSAPDISRANRVTNDNRALTVALHIANRASFSPGDVYSVYFDTDSNARTGSDAGSGAPIGAEYAVDIVYGRPMLLRWNGSSFEAVTPRAPVRTGWLDGIGPLLRVGLADLGIPNRLGLVFVTTRVGDRDLAPDAGEWPYTVSPLELRAGRVAVERTGRSVVARMKVVRSDLDTPLTEGAIACNARVGRRTLVGRGAFVRERATCTWRIPRTARGKRTTGSVTVTFQDVTAKRSFSVRSGEQLGLGATVSARARERARAHGRRPPAPPRSASAPVLRRVTGPLP
jgi:hypothetical protein